MSKTIIVFHQPFPQGNYKLNTFVAEHLKNKNHKVYLLEQLNGVPCTNEFIEMIKSVNPDVLYFEMLDKETFKAVEQINCKKILVYASRGILPNFEVITDFYNKWFTDIYTNSYELFKFFKSKNIPTKHFEYYFSCIKNEECTIEEKYKHDCVFLGMGFARINDEHYNIERKLFFDGINNIDFAIYGNGWPNLSYYKGLLPANDIGKLYSSTRSAIAIIGSGQRSKGMINNRYTELLYCGTPIFSIKYPSINWYGGENFINFVETKQDIINLLSDGNRDILKEKSLNGINFIKNKHDQFFNTLESLL